MSTINIESRKTHKWVGNYILAQNLKAGKFMSYLTQHQLLYPI